MCDKAFVEFCKTEPLDVEENVKLVRQWQVGDLSARDKLIVGNMGLVIWKVDCYLACNPQYQHLRDDLVSEGNVKLIEVIDNLRSLTLIADGQPITAYIGLHIFRHIGHWAEENNTIMVARTTARRRRKAGHNVPYCNGYDDLDGMAPSDDQNVVDLRDMLLSCCHTSTERKYIELAEQKCDLNSISEELDLSKSTVYALRQTIYARYLAKSDYLRAA